MSTNKTEHLQLHRWEAADTFSREEFNENFQKIDAGVKGAETAAAAALSAYQTANDKALADGLSAQTAALNAYRGANDAAVAALSAERIALGSYVGDGTVGRQIQLPFAPKFVIVMGHYCSGSYDNPMIAIITEQDCRYVSSGGCGSGLKYNLLLVGDKLSVQHAGYNNTEGRTVYYIAIR